jgi:hypothetical protein
MALYKLGPFYIIKKTIKPSKYIKKRTFMINKFGKLKALVLIVLHRDYLINVISNYLLDIKNNIEMRMQIEYASKMYAYINLNADVIYDMGKFTLVCRYKLKEFNRMHNNRFINYSYSLNYVCSYTNRDGTSCKHDSYNGFDICKKHLRCQFNRELKIQKSLKGTGLFNDIIDIIIKYDYICV